MQSRQKALEAELLDVERTILRVADQTPSLRGKEITLEMLNRDHPEPHQYWDDFKALVSKRDRLAEQLAAIQAQGEAQAASGAAEKIPLSAPLVQDTLTDFKALAWDCYYKVSLEAERIPEDLEPRLNDADFFDGLKTIHALWDILQLDGVPIFPQVLGHFLANRGARKAFADDADTDDEEKAKIQTDLINLDNHHSATCHDFLEPLKEQLDRMENRIRQRNQVQPATGPESKGGQGKPEVSISSEFLIYLDMKESKQLAKSKGVSFIDQIITRLQTELKSYGVSDNNCVREGGDCLKVACSQSIAGRFLGFLKEGFEVSGMSFEIRNFNIFLDIGAYKPDIYDPKLQGIGDPLLKNYQYIITLDALREFSENLMSQLFPDWEQSDSWTEEDVSWGPDGSTKKRSRVYKKSDPLTGQPRQEAVMTTKKPSDPSTTQGTVSDLYSELYKSWFSKQSPLIQSQSLMIMNERNKEQAAARQASMAQSALSPATSRAARPQDIPEAGLDYEKIISIIFNAGKDMERRRKTYAAKKEEELRDHLLTALNAQYRGKATAETFSSEGKTDIFLPLDEGKAFIAECKIWRGKNQFRKAINQLLGQPIRSDNKTALIVFNHNKNTSRVQAKIKEELKGHPNYKRFDENTESETKLCYTLHHPKDQALELTLTVLVFDLPRK